MGTRGAFSDVTGLVGDINARHSSSWIITGRLAGGYQQGAYELRDSSGTRAVLKWHRRHLPEPQLRATAKLLADARSGGWPTSAWLAYGPLPNDGGYIVEEFIEGEHPKTIDQALLARLLAAVKLQSGMQPKTTQNWSSYIYRCVFEGEEDLAARMRARPETAALQDRMSSLVAPARGISLPADDLVHGDIVLNNIVVRGGQPFLLDAAHAGRGTRAYDLATLLMETSVGGDYVAPSDDVRRRLEDEGVAVAGRGAFLVCVVCRIMHLLVFGGVNWSADVPAAVHRCHAFLDQLGELR